MASLADVLKPQGVVLENPSYKSGGGGGGGGGGSGSSFAGLEGASMDVLLKYLQSAMNGGTEDYKAQRAERRNQIAATRAEAGKYTKEAAFSDAADLMAQQLRLAMEKNMPAIARSIQGAGTSASSMQGLLSQKLATESAQAAGALGAEQARAYGGIQGQLQGILEGLTRVNTEAEQNLINALNVAKVQRSSEVTNPTNPTRDVVSGGGGSYYQPTGRSAPSFQGGAAGRGPATQQSYEPGQGGSYVSIQRTNDGFVPADYSGGFGYRPPQEYNDYPDYSSGFGFGGGGYYQPIETQDNYIPQVDTGDSGYVPNDYATALFGDMAEAYQEAYGGYQQEGPSPEEMYEAERRRQEAEYEQQYSGY